PFKRAGALRPDFVLRLHTSPPRWLLIEVKGVERPVWDSAREALRDLLAYRRAFDPVLGTAETPYGLGIAWGESMQASTEIEVALCTPDMVEDALARLLTAT
ncbi:MAG TPA: hypothetical protein VKB17_00005, partial [Thermoleophilaceae bacterium]|nr:hypothetical protein [Thermoleophilaceae bacterium]